MIITTQTATPTNDKIVRESITFYEIKNLFWHRERDLIDKNDKYCTCLIRKRNVRDFLSKGKVSYRTGRIYIEEMQDPLATSEMDIIRPLPHSAPSSASSRPVKKRTNTKKSKTDDVIVVDSSSSFSKSSKKRKFTEIVDSLLDAAETFESMISFCGNSEGMQKKLRDSVETIYVETCKEKMAELWRALRKDVPLVEKIRKREPFECSICLEPYGSEVCKYDGCTHVCCKACSLKLIRHKYGEFKCHICRRVSMVFHTIHL